MFATPTIERPTIPFRAPGRAGRNLIELSDDFVKWCSLVAPGLKGFAAHHKQFGVYLESVVRGERANPLINIWPRGGGKSTLLELGVGYLAERKKRTFCLYMCSTQGASERHVQAIENLFGKIGGSLAREAKNVQGHSRGWRASMIRTEQGFNIVGLGLDTAMRGIKLDDDRPNLIILDDIDDRHDTQRTIKKKIETLTNTIIPAGSDDAIVIGAQNLVHSTGIFSQLAGEADFLADRVVVGPIPAIEGIQTKKEYSEELERAITIITGGDPTWPGYGLDKCQQKILDMGWRAFDREMQQNVKEVEGAMWTRELINKLRLPEPPEDGFSKAAVAIDPAGTDNPKNDETGIIAGGRDARKHTYVTHDASGHWKPSVWGRKAVLLHDKIGATCIVGEANNGGDMVADVVQNAADNLHREGERDSPKIRVEIVHASKGKRARAEPVAQRYEYEMVHHVGSLPDLEDQQTTWDADAGDDSPDRVDALVWLDTFLVPVKQPPAMYVP